jgi:hypothetical protein
MRVIRWLDDFGLIETKPPTFLGDTPPKDIRINELGKRLLDFDVPEFHNPYE